MLEAIRRFIINYNNQHNIVTTKYSYYLIEFHSRNPLLKMSLLIATQFI